MSDDSGARRVSRRSVLASAAVSASALATSTLPAPASASAIDRDAVGDSLTLAAAEAATDPRWRAAALEDLAESSGVPTWIVEYREGSLSSLEEWANGARRELLDRHTHTASRTAVVRASPYDVGASGLARWLGAGLASREYVEVVDANPILEIPQEIEPAPASEAFPEWSATDRYIRFGGDPPVSDGLAFDDVEPAPMSSVRSAIGADGITASPTIAVVDTGVNTAGASLFGDGTGAEGTRVLTASKNMISGDTVADAGLGAVEDGNGHGTFVAAQVAGDPPDSYHGGILPNADVLAIRALDDEGSGATANIAAGIRYAADQGADVIVLSLGSPAYSYELDRALEYAAGAGSIAVAAVGNDRWGSRWVASPAATRRPIAVASTTAGLGDSEVRSSYYSNVAPHPGTTDLSGGETTDAAPDLSAPGHEIETTVARPDGTLSTEVRSGTSMSAPIVGGVVGALGESDPSVVRETLTSAAEPIPLAAEAEVGSGQVDAERALSGGSSDAEQAEVMGEDAQVRDDAYRTESDAKGRVLLGWLL